MPSTSGPAQIVIGEGAGSITLDREDQFENAVLTVNRLVFEHRTQLSAAPFDYRKTGLNLGLALSISDADNLDLIALAFNTVVETDATTPTKKRVVLRDDAGKTFARQKVVIKPYLGDVLAPADAWWTFPSGAVVSTDDFVQTFGLEAQRTSNLTIMGLADPTTLIKAIYGDATVVPA